MFLKLCIPRCQNEWAPIRLHKSWVILASLIKIAENPKQEKTRRKCQYWQMSMVKCIQLCFKYVWLLWVITGIVSSKFLKLCFKAAQRVKREVSVQKIPFFRLLLLTMCWCLPYLLEMLMLPHRMKMLDQWQEWALKIKLSFTPELQLERLKKLSYMYESCLTYKGFVHLSSQFGDQLTQGTAGITIGL